MQDPAALTLTSEYEILLLLFQTFRHISANTADVSYSLFYKRAVEYQ